MRVYDLVTETWTTWPSLSIGRYGHKCVVTKGGVLVTGGYIPGQGFTDETLLIDSTTGISETVGPMNTPRAYHELVIINGKVTAIGGEDGNRYLSSVEQYNDQTNTWVTSTTSLTQARSSFATLIVATPASDLCG